MNLELKKLLTNKNNVVVWDIDGTLTEARWDNKNIVFYEEDNIHRLKRHKEGINIGLKPIKLMQDIVNDFVSSHKLQQYTLSNICSPIEIINKNNMLDKSFPEIIKENRYYTRTIQEKIDMLECIRICNSKSNNFIYISDSVDELIEMNKYFKDLDMMYFYHTSSLFV